MLVVPEKKIFLEDSVFWYVPSDIPQEVPKMHSGVDYSDFVKLESCYVDYMRDVYTQEIDTRCRCGSVNDYTLSESVQLIAEAKSLSKLKIPKKRHSLHKQFETKRDYEKYLIKNNSKAKKAYEKDVEDFKAELLDEIDLFQKKKIDLDSLSKKTAVIFRKYYEKAFHYGRQASAIHKLVSSTAEISQDEEKWFRSTVREELSHWNSFLKELPKYDNRRFSIINRVEMYAATIQSMYNAGQVSGFPANVLLFWYPTRKVSGEMCVGCQYMVDNSPFTRDTMPTVPRAGDTPCLFRCKHKIIVRVSTPYLVKKRESELPLKSTMLSQLRRFMGGRLKKKRERHSGYNPWLGEKGWNRL